ncbi:MAG: lipid A deacylase LpxR family protein [Rhodospirillales bacterium]
MFGISTFPERRIALCICMRRFCLSLALISALGFVAPGTIGIATAGTWTLSVENDRIANTDRHYSNGVRLGWISDADDGTALPEVRDALQMLYPLADVRGGRLGLELGHNIYTPNDTKTRNRLQDDRPYAGWLYASASLYAETGKGLGDHYTETLDKMALEFGVVGPAALGEPIQNEYHKLINVETSKGWDNQIGNEPGINLIGERKWRHKALRFVGFEADAIPHVGGSLGNVYTHLNGGVILRVGQELYVDFGPPLIRPSLSGFGAINPAEKLAWYAFAGVDGRWVLRNIFLDGNTFSDSHSVDKKPLVADFVTGVAITYDQLRIAFTHVIRTREFDTQAESDRFGSLSLSVRF